MNCKQGDLAIVVGPLRVFDDATGKELAPITDHIGSIVRCVSPMILDDCDAGWVIDRRLPYAYFRKATAGLCWGTGETVALADSILRPIRPGDESDESDEVPATIGVAVGQLALETTP